jgi:hypothetical protein
MELTMHGYDSLARLSTTTGQATSFGALAELDVDGWLELADPEFGAALGGLEAVPCPLTVCAHPTTATVSATNNVSRTHSRWR